MSRLVVTIVDGWVPNLADDSNTIKVRRMNRDPIPALS